MCIVSGGQTMQQPALGVLDQMRNARSACVLSSIVVLKQFQAITGNTGSKHNPGVVSHLDASTGCHLS